MNESEWKQHSVEGKRVCCRADGSNIVEIFCFFGAFRGFLFDRTAWEWQEMEWEWESLLLKMLSSKNKQSARRWLHDMYNSWLGQNKYVFGLIIHEAYSCLYRL